MFWRPCSVSPRPSLVLFSLRGYCWPQQWAQGGGQSLKGSSSRRSTSASFKLAGFVFRFPIYIVGALMRWRGGRARSESATVIRIPFGIKHRIRVRKPYKKTLQRSQRSCPLRALERSSVRYKKLPQLGDLAQKSRPRALQKTGIGYAKFARFQRFCPWEDRAEKT